jgi:hypothetical protein
MNRLMLAGFVLTVAASAAQAEPVFMPQAASALKAHQAEAGVNGHFGYQTSELASNPGTTYKNRVWQFPLYARYGILDMLEAHVVLPIARAVDSSEGLFSSRGASTGLGNIQMGSKWNFVSAPFPLAVALDLDLPTANSKNNAGALGARYSGQLQQGFNGHLQFVMDSPALAEKLTFHGALGYMNTGAYSTSTGFRYNPSDLMTFGASADVNLSAWVSHLSAAAEFVGNTALNHSKNDGVKNGNDKGTVLEVGPSLRYQVGRWRAQTGLLIDAGQSEFRAYNYRVQFGLSALFGAL